MSPSSFEKQRDFLVQEIASALDSVVYNLDILNRSLNESIQVGKEFDNVGRLWSNFYDAELKGKPAAESLDEAAAKPTQLDESDEQSEPLQNAELDAPLQISPSP